MKVRIGIIFGVISISLVALILFTGKKKSGTVVITDVKQVLANPAKYQDREIRVRGFVKAGSIIRYGDKAKFILTFEEKDLPVVFNGKTQLPDTFADGAPARADGKLHMVGANMKLDSDKVEAKCASKYEAKHVEGTKPKAPAYLKKK